MALVQCPDCHVEVSDAAAACPRCARPMNAAATPSAPPRKKTGFFDLRRNLIALLTLLGIGYAVWCFLPDDSKEAVRALAAGTGADKVIPLSWEARARDRAAMTGTQEFGQGIVSLTHPTATFLRMEPVRTAESEGLVTVTYGVVLAGGFTGSEYRMAIQWKFDKAHNAGAEITEDTAPMPVLTGSILNKAFQSLYDQISAELAK